LADLTSKDGQTALVVAVGRNDAEVARLLVSGGADPDLPDKLGLTARKYAALFKNPAILALFDQAE
jgi:ankyrin repeat protein